MKSSKEKRVKLLSDILDNIKELKNSYSQAYPGWTLAKSAQGFIISLHHLEADPNFQEKMLGVKDE